jgi:hypothetical protein
VIAIGPFDGVAGGVATPAVGGVTDNAVVGDSVGVVVEVSDGVVASDGIAVAAKFSGKTTCWHPFPALRTRRIPSAATGAVTAGPITGWGVGRVRTAWAGVPLKGTASDWYCNERSFPGQVGGTTGKLGVGETVTVIEVSPIGTPSGLLTDTFNEVGWPGVTCTPFPPMVKSVPDVRAAPPRTF